MGDSIFRSNFIGQSITLVQKLTGSVGGPEIPDPNFGPKLSLIHFYYWCTMEEDMTANQRSAFSLSFTLSLNINSEIGLSGDLRWSGSFFHKKVFFGPDKFRNDGLIIHGSKLSFVFEFWFFYSIFFNFVIRQKIEPFKYFTGSWKARPKLLPKSDRCLNWPQSK